MTLNPHTAGEYAGALTFINGEIDALPATVYGTGAADQVRARRSQLARVRVMLSSGRAASEALDGIAALCGCNTGPDTDGPEQDCPIHGDGESFVMLCRFRDTVVALAHGLVGALLASSNDGTAMAPDAGKQFMALQLTLDNGPWASSTDVATPAAAQSVAPDGEVWGPARTGPRGF